MCSVASQSLAHHNCLGDLKGVLVAPKVVLLAGVPSQCCLTEVPDLIGVLLGTKAVLLLGFFSCDA